VVLSKFTGTLAIFIVRRIVLLSGCILYRIAYMPAAAHRAAVMGRACADGRVAGCDCTKFT